MNPVNGGTRAPITIVSVETIPIRVPLARIYRGSHYQMTHRSTIIIRIRASDGSVGEAYAGDEDSGLEEINEIIHREIVPAIIGHDIFETERLWELARPVTWNILRDQRLGLVAAACVDTAIWDAVGKALNMPLHRLWGGYATSLPVITIGGYYGADLEIEDEVHEVLEAGYAGMKFKIGGLSPEEDVVRVRRARKAGGDSFSLAVDANQGWTPPEAIRFAKAAEDLNIMWFEEPCRWQNDRKAMRDVRYMGGIPVCAGQSEFSAGGCRDLFEAGAVDFCNFDASWSGGPTEWRRVAAMAGTYDVKMAHHEEPQVAAHLLASISNGTFLENFHPTRDPIWHGLVANRAQLKNGRMQLPEGPGLGWQLDEDFIKKYQISF